MSRSDFKQNTTSECIKDSNLHKQQYKNNNNTSPPQKKTHQIVKRTPNHFTTGNCNGCRPFGKPLFFPEVTSWLGWTSDVWWLDSMVWCFWRFFFPLGYDWFETKVLKLFSRGGKNIFIEMLYNLWGMFQILKWSRTTTYTGLWYEVLAKSYVGILTGNAQLGAKSWSWLLSQVFVRLCWLKSTLFKCLVQKTRSSM